ncbi:hypothetical protein CSKR_201206 [Clonorchis sinensis]|uniref:Uncharacterized protein n=1 Tax=Clonorchis sinensis TaxID=79923 RepID=A0A8T1MNA1_CLOSI|nr:hypothetical protein CSKR_201206 [Clonorchis sinensis]
MLKLWIFITLLAPVIPEKRSEHDYFLSVRRHRSFSRDPVFAPKSVYFADDVVLNLNFDCPVHVVNVTVGQRIIVVCSRRDSRPFQRIYMSYNPDTTFLCDTFHEDVKIVGSCLSGVRDQEVIITVCRKGMRCSIPMAPEDRVLIFSSEESCIHQVSMLLIQMKQ